MESLFDSLRWGHIVVGSAGLVAFWIPLFAKKGGRLHIRGGKVFEYAAYFVTGTAIFNSFGRMITALVGGATLAENREAFGFLIFLGYLGIVVLASVRQAVRVAQVKKDVSALKTPFHLGLAVAGIIGSVTVIAYALLAWSSVSVVLLALSPIGIMQGLGMLRFIYDPPPERMSWWYAHMGNMLGAGIGFYTAFAVFGSSRLFDITLTGALNFVPWILPAALGIPANVIWERYYRRKFRDLPRKGSRAEAKTAV